MTSPHPELQLSLFHGSCATHINRRLSCDDIEALRAASGYACRLCGRTGPSSAKRPHGLVTDHDHAIGDHAIRGTLCLGCNSAHMGGVDSGRYPIGPRTRDYLANPFYLARHGRTLPYDPAPHVSVADLNEHDRAELDRLRPRPTPMYLDYQLKHTSYRFDHPGVAACVEAGDLRPVRRLLRCAYIWYLPGLDIAATGDDIPGGDAEDRFLPAWRPEPAWRVAARKAGRR